MNKILHEHIAPSLRISLITMNSDQTNSHQRNKDKDDNSLVKQSLRISFELYNSHQNNFFSNLMKMSEYISIYLILITIH